LLNYATPFLWLVAARSGNTDASPGYATARGLLALLGAIQVLYAYPVAGSQVVFVAVLMIVVAGVCFWDGLSWLRRNRLESLAKRIRNRWLTVARVSAALLIAGLNLAFAWDARRTYESFSPLDFRFQTRARRTRQGRRAARHLSAGSTRPAARCSPNPGYSAFICGRGNHRPAEGPSALMSLLDDATQNAIVDKLSRDPQACVVYQQELAILGAGRGYPGETDGALHSRELPHGYRRCRLLPDDAQRNGGLNAALCGLRRSSGKGEVRYGSDMRIASIAQLVLLVLTLRCAGAQGTVPTFQYTVGQGAYTLLGSDPAVAASTTIPTVLVPLTLSFDAKKIAGKPFVMDAAPDVPGVLRSPVFTNFAFPSGGTTQYADAMLVHYSQGRRVAHTSASRK
jgi:hypothetical protein